MHCLESIKYGQYLGEIRVTGPNVTIPIYSITRDHDLLAVQWKLEFLVTRHIDKRVKSKFKFW